MIKIEIYQDDKRLGYFDMEVSQYNDLINKNLLNAWIEYHVMNDFDYYLGYSYTIKYGEA